MRFLVTALPRDPLPPEVGLMLARAMMPYTEKYKDKIVQHWAFAGLGGGGAILEVDSHEELNKIMNEFPFFSFSNIKILAMSDLATGMDDLARQLEAAVQGMPH